MTFLAAPDLATTLAGIAFWVIVLAAYVALFAATLVSVTRARLDRQARTRWIWLVILAPGIGIIAWFLKGRPAAEKNQSRV